MSIAWFQNGRAILINSNFYYKNEWTNKDIFNLIFIYNNLPVISKISIQNKINKKGGMSFTQRKIVSYLLPRRKRPLLSVILSLKPSSLYRWSFSWVTERRVYAIPYRTRVLIMCYLSIKWVIPSLKKQQMDLCHPHTFSCTLLQHQKNHFQDLLHTAITQQRSNVIKWK